MCWRNMLVGVMIATMVVNGSIAQDNTSFTFESVESFEEMQSLIDERFYTDASRSFVRALFVDQGRATLIDHPVFPNVEKYIYDINLCDYYVWRWNISADYDEAGTLRQIYVNGEPALASGAPPRPFVAKSEPGEQGAVYRMSRPRPEARKGESSLGYLLFDMDSDSETIDDQQLIGAGPSQPDPLNMGRLRTYRVEPWRSIFDSDLADFIAPYQSDCSEVDAEVQATMRGDGSQN